VRSNGNAILLRTNVAKARARDTRAASVSRSCLIGKLESRTVEVTNRKAIELINAARRTVRTVTVDNGTEFHGFKEIEKRTGSRLYFAKPYHSWERGTSENTNGLIRQYFPKRQSMKHVSQDDCDRLNRRPRKRLDYRTPEECFESI